MTDSNIQATAPQMRLQIQGLLVGLAVIGAGIAVLLVWFREFEGPHQAVELLHRVESLPASTMKSFSLSLPFAGTLTVSTKSIRGETYSAYLVQQHGGRPNLRNNELRLIAPFTAEHVSRSTHSRVIEAGEYNLMLIRADTPAGSTDVSVELYARLDP